VIWILTALVSAVKEKEQKGKGYEGDCTCGDADSDFGSSGEAGGFCSGAMTFVGI